MKKGCKSAQAQILVTVLIILGVIIVIAIVYSVIKPLVSEKSGDIQSSYERLQLMNALTVKGFNQDGNNLEIIVSRDSTPGDFSRIKFTVNTDEETCYIEQAGSLAPLETKTFDINMLDYDCSGSVQSVSAEPILGEYYVPVGGGTAGGGTPQNPINITSCKILNESNTIYTLQNNVSSTGTCFTIEANNIALDCQGYEISYSSVGVLGYGISNFGGYNFTTVKNCKIKQGSFAGKFNYAIYFNGAKNGTIDNNIIKTSSYGDFGIYLKSSSTNTLSNNNIITSGYYGYGIYLYLSSNSNTLSNNNITTSGYSSYGIWLYSSSTNILSNNIITTSGYISHGIHLYSSSTNTLLNNTIRTSGTTSYGIHLYLSLTNTVLSNTITTYSGIYLSSSSNNTLSSNTITTLSYDASSGIYLESSSNNNITDSTISSSESSDVFLFSTSTNNIFLNTTYSSEYVQSGSSLTRKWYYRAYVNDASGNNVSGANVLAYNVLNSYQFNLTTDNTGYTSLGDIIDYVNNGGTRSYYSLYNITAFNSNYLPDSHTYDATSNQSNYKDVFRVVHVIIKRAISGNNITLNIASRLVDYETIMIAEELPVGSIISNSSISPTYNDNNIFVWLFSSSPESYFGNFKLNMIPNSITYTVSGSSSGIKGKWALKNANEEGLIRNIV